MFNNLLNKIIFMEKQFDWSKDEPVVAKEDAMVREEAIRRRNEEYAKSPEGIADSQAYIEKVRKERAEARVTLEAEEAEERRKEDAKLINRVRRFLGIDV